MQLVLKEWPLSFIMIYYGAVFEAETYEFCCLNTEKHGTVENYSV